MSETPTRILTRAERRAARQARVLATVEKIRGISYESVKNGGMELGRAHEVAVREVRRGFTMQEIEVLRIAIRTYCYRSQLPKLLDPMIRVTNERPNEGGKE